MNLLCKIFGHKIASEGSYRRYFCAKGGAIDGIGRHHIQLTCICDRCEDLFVAGYIHGTEEGNILKRQREPLEEMASSVMTAIRNSGVKAKDIKTPSFKRAPEPKEEDDTSIVNSLIGMSSMIFPGDADVTLNSSNDDYSTPDNNFDFGGGESGGGGSGGSWDSPSDNSAFDSPSSNDY